MATAKQYLGLYPPFGANLFMGNFSGTYQNTFNPDYTVIPGDQIQINLWGAHAFSQVLVVDQMGNIFLPEVGPVPVAGVSNGGLQQHIKEHIATTFKSKVDLYATLLSAKPMAVYVSGFVQRPGRYAGGLEDSVLFFLDAAGGIVPDRGSYRDITIKRDNRTIVRIDLYEFILSGKLPGGHLRNGDVVVVGSKGNTVVAGGLIPQQATYEGPLKSFKGLELLRLATPKSEASHVSVTGVRNATPFHVYMSINEFKSFTLAQDDKVEFVADQPGDTILVAVSGAVAGATRFPVARNTTLRSLLSYVQVSPDLANLSGIYIKRASVAEQQKKAIDDALRRLEQAVLTVTSNTQEGAQIRAKEAEMVQNFIIRASTITPSGIVVVTQKGYTEDIILENGDEIVIPQKSDIVQIVGEVMMPKATVFDAKLGLRDYISQAGGFSERADKSNILIVHPNGEVQQTASGKIQPGDLLLVMPHYDVKSFGIAKDIIQVMYQIAIASAVLLAL